MPEYGISVVNQYYTMSEGMLYRHHVHDVDRNTFYGEFEESLITPILNLQPDVIKNFNTINYEGSQSKIDDFTTLIQNGVNYTDEEYYNLYSKDGWYVNDIHTDKQEGKVNEFIEKEGKWFNYIKSDFGTIDPNAFNFQGIGIVDDVTTIPGVICGCMHSGSFNYNPNATADCACVENGSDNSCCVEVSQGCTDPTATNFSSNANTPCDSGGGPNDCCRYTAYGCMDGGSTDYTFVFGDGPDGIEATNYNALATIDDGSCYYSSYAACIDPNADNYDNSYYFDCGGFANGNNYSCCTYSGCTDPTAYNYDPNATNDDGSCLYSSIYGCMDNGTLGQTWWDSSVYPALYNVSTYPTSGATNYDNTVTVDNGSCLYTSLGVISGCTDDGANGGGSAPVRDQAWWTVNYANAPYPGGGNYPIQYPGYNMSSPYYRTAADNYNPLATVDDGSCLYDNTGGDSPCGCLPCPTSGPVTDCSEPHGCCDPTAINYDAKANCNDGSCNYNNPVFGCTDPLAINYNPTASTVYPYDWTCVYLDDGDTSTIGSTRPRVTDTPPTTERPATDVPVIDTDYPTRSGTTTSYTP